MKYSVIKPGICFATLAILAGCNGSSSSSQVNGSNATGTPLNASKSAALFVASQCLSGSIKADSSQLWYTSSTINITNSCATQQNLSSQSVNFTSQDKGGNEIAAGSYNNWWINNAAYSLTFVNGGGHTQTGSFTTSTAGESVVINPGQTIAFSGGFNLNGIGFNSSLAESSFAISDGSSPPVVQTGSLMVTVDTTKAGCTSVNCNNLSVLVVDRTGKTVATITVPVANTNALYSQTVNGLIPNSYTLQASSINGDSLSYTPAATATIRANATTNATISYTQNPVVQAGQIQINLPTIVAAYTGNVNVNILNTKESNVSVASFSLAQGQSITSGLLPISDSNHAYAVQIQGVADPKNALAYIESGLPVVTVSANKVTALSPKWVAAPTRLVKITFNESGLQSGDNATISFQGGSNKYAYVSYSGITNGSQTYSFESGLNIAYSVQAGQSNYQINPLTGSIVATGTPSVNLSFTAQTPGSATVAGWPNYIAMGAVGGPNISTPTATSIGGNDDFGSHPVDAVFKYGGVNGNGDPGVIDPPTNALSMTNDLTAVSKINARPARVIIVEYTSQMSGGENFSDFSNAPAGASSSQANASYIMARHFNSLAADAIALANKPVSYNGQNYYGSLIMNPDLLGAIQQNNYIANVNTALPAGAVNTAVDQTLCLMSTVRSYTNSGNPNGASSAAYLNKTYTGTPVQILMAMLNDGYPVWSINGSNDPFWSSGLGSSNQVETWFQACISNPIYDTAKYARPNFPAGFEGWVQANNWLIRTFAAKNTVTFGWQDNMWAVNSGYWLHNNLTESMIAANYSTPVSTWLATNAPSTIKTGTLGSQYTPDYFLFDRYEADDSAGAGAATLYNARSWDNYLTAVGKVSANFNNIPIMLWQIPGSHLPYVGESMPELYNNTAGSYIFSTAPVYFFGDNHLKADLSNLILGAASNSSPNTAVGNFLLACGTSAYNCLAGTTTYQQYLLSYQNLANNYNWGKANDKLALAAKNHVFAILWGGGNTTNVIKNFSNPDDHGWLSAKLITYYTNPQPVSK